MKIRRSSLEPLDSNNRLLSPESRLKHRTLDPKLENRSLDPKLENRPLDPKLKERAVNSNPYDQVNQTRSCVSETHRNLGQPREQNPTHSERILKPRPGHGVSKSGPAYSSSKSISKPSHEHSISKPCVTSSIPKPIQSLLLVPSQNPVTKFATLMKKFGETELSNQNQKTLSLQDSHQNSGETPPLNVEGIEEDVKLMGKDTQDQGFQLSMVEGLKKPDYLAPTPPGSDYEELSISAASPEFNTLTHPDILSPPLSISSGLDFPHSPFLPQYHVALSPTSQISKSPSTHSSRSSPSTVGFGRHLSSSPISTISTSPIPDLLPTSPLSQEFSSTSFHHNSPISQDQLSSTSPTLEFNDEIYISPLTEPGQSDPIDGIKFSKCSYSDYTNALVQSFVDGKFDTFTIVEAKEHDFKFSKSNEFLLSSLGNCINEKTPEVIIPPEIKEEPACKVCSSALCLCTEPSKNQCNPDDNQEISDDNHEDRLETRIEGSKLPDDIPTLSSLAKSSPKLSTWRQTRIVSEKLEQHLWIWRCACKKSGKRISKSLLQARAKWAFRKAGILEFKASDGWYWKWLAKWRRKGEEIGIKEQGQLTHEELKIMPCSAAQKTLVKTEMFGTGAEVCECSLQDHTSEFQFPVLKRKQENSQNESQRKIIRKEPILSLSADLSRFISLEKPGDPASAPREEQFSTPREEQFPTPREEQFPTPREQQFPTPREEQFSTPREEQFPNRIVPVRDILPLTLSGNEIMLAPHHTDSNLPISPIFIKTGLIGSIDTQQQHELIEYSSGILEGFEEFPTLSSEFLNLDSLCNWQGEIEDIDTDTLVSSLSTSRETVSRDGTESPGVGKNTPGQGSEKHSPSIPGNPEIKRESCEFESGSVEPAEQEPRTQVTPELEPDEQEPSRIEPRTLEPSRLEELSSGEVCGIHCKKLKQVYDERYPLYIDPELNKPTLTTIAVYKKRGEESLNRFKEEVRKFAVDHTFKETAKRFGIHHSTVSGWVKESEKLDKSSNNDSFSRERGDEKFIQWLREFRESGKQVSLNEAKKKVTEILLEYGTQEIEKTCKWFLLWHNRREERLYVEGMEDEDIKKETQNLAYPPAFKLEVALFAKKHSQYAAAKIFNVARRRIFDWMRQIPKLEELIAKGHMKKMTGRGPKNRDIDQALYTWYCERKARGNRPKSCHVQSKARELYLTYGYRDMKCSYGWFKRWSQRFQIQLRYSYDDEILEWIMSRFDENESVNAQDLQNYGLNLIQKEDPNFKASSGWALRFCKRHKEFMNSEGSFSSKLPHHLESRIRTFRRVLYQLQQEKRFGKGCVGSVDELLIHFNSILEKRSGCVLKHAGIDTSDVVIILSLLSDGTLLTPLVLFKKDEEGGEKTREMELYRRGSLLILENASSLSEVEFGVWLEQVWFSSVPSPSFLLADSFPVHTEEQTKKLVLKKDSVLAIIPRACSSKLQPLHQGAKLRFRTYLEDSYLSSVKSNLGRGDGRPVPDRDTIIQWIDEAYNNIKQEKEELARGFRKTAIFQ